MRYAGQADCAVTKGSPKQAGAAKLACWIYHRGVEFRHNLVTMRERQTPGYGRRDGKPMRGVSRITYVWPGLYRLWYQGDLAALPLAIAFAVLLNAVLLVSFLRTGDVPGSWRLIGWGAVVALGSVSAWRGIRGQASATSSVTEPQRQDLFIRAQGEYLKGHWAEAQGLLEQLIRRQPDDVESHLLLSSVYRRSGRRELSRQRLAQVKRFEGAEYWRWEIQREFALLDRSESAGTQAAQ